MATLSELFHAHLLTYCAKDTADCYARRLRYALRHGLRQHRVQARCRHELTAYIARQRATAPREAFRNDVRMANALAKWLHIEAGFEYPTCKSATPVALRPRDLRAVMQFRARRRDTQRRARAILQLAAFTGMRRIELSRVRLDDLDPVRSRIFVRAGKESPERWVPVERRLWRADRPLGMWLRHRPPAAHDRVFCSLHRPHGPMQPACVGNVLSRVGRTVGVPCSSRILRHTRATQLLRAGWSLPEVAYMLGDSIEVAARYAEVVYEDVEALMRSTRPGTGARRPRDAARRPRFDAATPALLTGRRAGHGR